MKVMTQSSINDILLYINDNIEIKKYIKSVVPDQYVDDMKSHLILEISKVKINKLDSMKQNNKLKYLAFRIVKNQMDPKCGNCFYKLMIKGSNDLEFKEELLDIKLIEKDNRLDKLEDILRGMKPWKVYLFNLYYIENMNFREISELVDMNIKTVQSWVYEVRNEVKNKLNKK